MRAAWIAYPILIALDAYFVSRALGSMRSVIWVLLGLHVCAFYLSVRGASRNQTSGGALGFYVSVVLAFFVLSGRIMVGVFIERSAVALVIVALALMAWGNGPRSFRLRVPESRGGKPGRWMRFFVTAAGLYVLGFLLMADPIPRASRAMTEWGSGVRQALGPMLTWVTELFGEGESSYSGEAEFTGGGNNNDFGEFRVLPQTADVKQTDEPKLYIAFEDRRNLDRVLSKRAYVTSQVLNWFEDDVWSYRGREGDVVEDWQDGEADGWVTLRNEPGPSIEHRVYLLGATGRSLPAYQGAFAYGFNRLLRMTDDWVQGGLQGKVTYRARSVLRNVEQLPDVALRVGDAGAEHRQLANAALEVRLRRVLAEAGASDGSVRERLGKLRRHFAENYEYSLVVENPGNRPPLENFLEHERKGYCDFYATVGALLCRAMGLPSRVAFGYGGGELYDQAGIIAYRERHGHAWTEIYLDGFGWVVWDLTPPGSGGAMPPIRGSGPAPDPEQFWDAQGEGADLEKDKRSWRDWLRGIPKPVIYGILIVLIVMWVTLRVLARMGKDEKDKKRKRRRRRSRRDPMAGIDPYPGYFIDFRKVCRALGFGYDEGSTLRELVARVRTGSEATAPGFDDMVSYHYRVRYEDGARNKRTEREFQKAIRRFWKDNAE